MHACDRTLSVYNGPVRLNIRIWGELSPSRPVLVLVHGFPDSSLIWQGIAERLRPYCCIVAPDVRGAGESTAPRRTRDYRLETLVADLAAVIHTVSPDHPVHLAGHDWGSIQCWEAVTTPLLQGRIASFTSISGPSLDHAAFWIRNTFTEPGHDDARKRRVINQLLHSWYIASFHLPLLPRLTWRVAFNKWPAGLASRFTTLQAEQFPSQAHDGLNGIRLYRANFIPRLLHPEGRWTDVPVQLVVPTDDLYVTPGLFDDITGWAPNLWRREVRAGHWVQLSHPDLVAGFLREFIQFLEGGQTAPALQASRQSRAP